jgi:NADH-quinone oxidoreductase subunit N
MNTLIAIIGLGVLCLLFEILNLRKAIIPMTIIGLLAILGLDISEFNSAAYYNNMIIVSKFSTAFSGLFIILTIFLVTLSHKFYENQTKISDFIAIKVFYWNSCHGVFWKLSYVLLGIEVLSIAIHFSSKQ